MTRIRAGVHVVTGASSGIGRATARRLALEGESVLLVGRNVPAMRRLQRDLLADAPRADVDVRSLDLTSRAEIESFAERLATWRIPVKALINNAGVSMSSLRPSAEGFETTWAVNVRAPYLLSRALLREGCMLPGAQILNVASKYHARRLDAGAFLRPRRLGGAQAYLQSKLCLILMTWAMAQSPLCREVRINALHPGIVRSRLGHDSWFANAIGRCAGLLLPSADVAARALCKVLSRVSASGASGAYFEDGRSTQIRYEGDFRRDSKRLLEALAQDVMPG